MLFGETLGIDESAINLLPDDAVPEVLKRDKEYYAQRAANRVKRPGRVTHENEWVGVGGGRRRNDDRLVPDWLRDER